MILAAWIFCGLVAAGITIEALDDKEKPGLYVVAVLLCAALGPVALGMQLRHTIAPKDKASKP